MSAIEQQLKRLQAKQLQLIKNYQSQQRELEKLRAEKERLSAEYTQVQDEYHQLKLQVQVLRSAAGQLGETDKKEFEKQLSAYIRDIDRCIHLLS